MIFRYVEKLGVMSQTCCILMRKSQVTPCVRHGVKKEDIYWFLNGTNLFLSIQDFKP